MSYEAVNPIGYVVALERAKIRINLHEGHKGQLAAHRLGINSVSQPGDLIGLDAGKNLVIARVTDMAFVEPERAHSSNVGTMNLTDMPLRQIVAYSIGFISHDKEHIKFVAESWKLPTLGAKAVPITLEYLSSIYGTGDIATDHLIELGKDSRTNSIVIKASINQLLSRHLAVLGSTGYGKSNFNALIARRIVTSFPKSRIVIFDVNGEYAQAFEGLSKIKHTILGNGAPRPPKERRDFKKAEIDYHQIPYQSFGIQGLIKLLRPSDKTQLPALRNALAAINMIIRDANDAIWAGNSSNGQPNWFELVDDCREDNQAELGNWLKALRTKGIPNVPNWPPFKALASLVAEFGCVAADSRNQGKTKRDAFSYSNVLPLVKIIQQLSEDIRFKEIINLNGGQNFALDDYWQSEVEKEVDYIFGKPAGEDQDWNVHIINLKNLADDHSPMVLGALLEMYSDVLFKRGQEKNYPTLLLLEEAHRYLRDPFSEETNQLKAYERLAKEGRKFNCSLLVSTQRPSDLSSTVLAMCSNWISLRLTNERDITALRYAIENGNEQTLSEISGLPRGDAIGFGSAFNLPVRFSIDKAEPGPESKDAAFAETWL